MTVTLTLFGAIREQLGKDEVEIIFPGKTTVRQALHRLKELHPAAAAYFDGSGVPLLSIAVGNQMAILDMELKGGEMLEVIAPIAGGSGK